MWCWIGQIDMNKPKSHIIDSWIWTGSEVSWRNGVKAWVDRTVLQWQATTDPLHHDVWWNIPRRMPTIAMLSGQFFFKQMVEYYCDNLVTIKWRKDFKTRIPASPCVMLHDYRRATSLFLDTQPLLPCTWPLTTSNQARHTTGGNNTHIVSSSWWWA